MCMCSLAPNRPQLKQKNAERGFTSKKSKMHSLHVV